MRPGILTGQVVLAVFAVLALVALVLPWWRRSRIRRAPTGLKLALSLTATIAIGFLLLNTLRDVEHTTTAGKRMCGGSYLFMLDTRLEITENLYHDCIVYSRVAIALLIAAALGVVGLEYGVLRYVASRRRVRSASSSVTVASGEET
jgi:hypothetical protein